MKMIILWEFADTFNSYYFRFDRWKLLLQKFGSENLGCKNMDFCDEISIEMSAKFFEIQRVKFKKTI